MLVAPGCRLTRPTNIIGLCLAAAAFVAASDRAMAVAPPNSTTPAPDGATSSAEHTDDERPEGPRRDRGLHERAGLLQHDSTLAGATMPVESIDPLRGGCDGAISYGSGLCIFLPENAVYRYINATPSTTVGAAPSNWYAESFDDSGWYQGPGAFGTSFGGARPNCCGEQTPNSPTFNGGTAWAVNYDPFLRTTFDVPASQPLTLWLAVDNGVNSIYLNGVLATAGINAEGAAFRWEHVFDIPAYYVLPGNNLIALQLEDHGVATGWAMVITADDTAPHPPISTNCPPIRVLDIQPQDGATFPAGTELVLTGRMSVVPGFPPLAEVTINGVPADSIDVAGRFFKHIVLGPGVNAFEIAARTQCSAVTASLEIQGATPTGQGVSDSAFLDATLAIALDYSNTTYNRRERVLVVQAVARNVSDRPVEAPLVMVIDHMASAQAAPANPDGYTDDGKPYYVFSDGASGPASLAPGESSPSKTLIFRSTQAQVLFEKSFLAGENGAPVFVTFPATSAVADRDYFYAARAVDPDGHGVQYSLQVRPACSTEDPGLPPCMQIDENTGEVLWTPNTDSLGVQTVEIRAEDDRGGVAVQRYLLEVGPVPANRPPLFTSGPLTRAAVGGPYSYTAVAVDPDGNPITYSLGGDVPDGMAINQQTGEVTWGFGLPGDYALIVEASDEQDSVGIAEQEFTLTAGDVPSNPHAPRLFGTPGVIAAVNRQYVYQPSGFDPDFGQTLLFSLAATPPPPAGMTIDSTSGRITWTPSAGQTDGHTVKLRVEDGAGGAASQQWTITVLTQLPNRPPVIDSIANFVALVDEPYEYDVSAYDPEGAPITFDLVAAPAGMDIDAASGLITWTPQAPGPVTVAIKVTDAQEDFGSQVFDLPVAPPNTPPTITSTPGSTVVVGATYRYRVAASDAENNPLAYQLVARPTGMTIHAATGTVLWTPTAADVGPHDVSVRVADPYGGLAEQAFTLTVAPDTTPPTVMIMATPDPAVMNEPVQICVQAGDNASVVGRTLAIDSVNMPLDGGGCTTQTYVMRQTLSLVGTATDAAGNIGSANRSLIIADPGDAAAPTVVLLTPDAGASQTVTAMMPIAITAAVLGDAAEPLQWEARLRRVEQTGPFDVLASGAGLGPELQIAAILDPSLLPNDTYYLALWASDGVHQREQNVLRVFVEGDRKLGNFQISFTDLTIPVAGIPLVITRQYDSLDTTSGDFGPGWRLGLPGRVCDEARESPVESLPVGSKVFVTRPDGRRVGFKVRFQQLPPGLFGIQLFPYLGYVRFDPEPGVTDSLSLEDADSVRFNLGGLLWTSLFGDPYNPNRYIFTTKEKVKYTLDEVLGLQRIEDIFGNTITVTPTGLHSSLGVSLTFVRDAQGRITQIIEPDDPNDPDPPGTLDYGYDPTTGNLVSFTTQIKTDPPTRYHYEDPDFPNYLTKIEDPLNQPIVRNVFDDDGRLVAQCDAMGDVTTLEGCVELDIDVGSSIQTVINARAYRTDLLIDERGNVLEQRRFFTTDPTDPNYDAADAGDMLVTQYTYWQTSSGGLTDWLHTESLQTRVAIGQPVGTLDIRETRTYDDRGNMLTRTEHGDELRTWHFAYSPTCDKATTEIDPLGNVTEYEYDAGCNLRFVTDALGGVTEYRYDSRGQRTHFIDAVLWNGTHPNVWQFHYDTFGLPSGVTDPLGNSSHMHFNRSGELKFQIDRRGWRIEFDYDKAHRVTTEVWRANVDAQEPGLLAVDETVSYSYNAAGFPILLASPDSSLAIEYWPTGLPKWVDNAGTPGAPRTRLTYGWWDSGTLRPGYDQNGNHTHTMDEWGNGTPVAYGMTQYYFDEFDRLASSVQYPLAGAVNPKRVNLDYYDTGLIQRLSRYSDAVGISSVATTIFGYDCNACPERISEIRHLAPNGDTLLGMVYERNAIGDVISISDSAGLHVFAYDSLRRLLTADHPSGAVQPDEFYSTADSPYDEAGNRRVSHVGGVYTYSYALGLGGNQLVADGAMAYGYDRNGNLISATAHATQEQFTVELDHRNRPTAIYYTSPTGETLAVETAYDALNRRLSLTVNGAPRYFVMDGENEYISVLDGSIASRSLGLLAIDDVVCDERDGTSWWPLTDHVLSVLAEVNDDRTIMHEFSYDSFGQLLTGLPAPGMRMFNSRDFYPGSRLGAYRARMYSPRLGRFVSEDGLEPYGYPYANLNPIYFVDPFGEVGFVENLVLRVKNFGQSVGKSAVGCLLSKRFKEIVFYVLLASQGEAPPQQVLLPPKPKEAIECVVDPKKRR